MHPRSRLAERAERIVAMCVNIHTQPEPNQLLLIRELTDGRKLQRIPNEDVVMPGTVARHDHRWRWSHRSFVHDHNIPFLI